MQLDEQQIFEGQRIGVLCSDPPQPIDAEAAIYRLGSIRIRSADQSVTIYNAMYAVSEIIPLLDKGITGEQLVASVKGLPKRTIHLPGIPRHPREDNGENFPYSV